MNRLVSRVTPIIEVDELAKTLELSTELLLNISRSANKYYRPNKPEGKPDGTTRQTYRVLEPLRDIQELIKNVIFYDVEYPDYLQGGIKDFQNPRDYVRNASKHSKNKVVIKEDIKNFFPSIKASHVFEMWRVFFGFSDGVADVLTSLTTYNGFVPQGAKTSSYIANIVFWSEEPELEDMLQSKGFTYTRLMDDITISTSRYLTKLDKQEVTKAVYQMMFRKGFKPKRRKRMVMSLGTRISIHNLNINSGTTTLSKEERRKIRSAVKNCETASNIGFDRKEYVKMFAKVRGKVAILERFHPNQAQEYLRRLEKIKPSKVYKDIDSRS